MKVVVVSDCPALQVAWLDGSNVEDIDRCELYYGADGQPSRVEGRWRDHAGIVEFHARTGWGMGPTKQWRLSEQARLALGLNEFTDPPARGIQPKPLRGPRKLDPKSAAARTLSLFGSGDENAQNRPR